MEFVLILAFVTGNAGLQYPAFAMQEFHTKASCEVAKATAEKMAASMATTNREVLRAECRPK